MEEEKPSESKIERVAVATWLSVISVVGVTKIIVACLSIGGDCHGITLLPYYLLITGVISLAPAAIAVTVSCSEQQTRNLEDTWSCAMKTLFFAVILCLAGTVYILTTTARATSLDRLCKQTWIPIFAMAALALDWILFLLFLRLFGPSQEKFESQFTDPFHPFHSGDYESSPFHVWKLRNTRRTL